MEDLEKNNQEVQDNLLLELKEFSNKINISKVLITLILITLPIVLLFNIIGLVSLSITSLSFVSLVVGLVLSLRMYNYNKILYSTHIWILDCLINEKPLR